MKIKVGLFAYDELAPLELRAIRHMVEEKWGWELVFLNSPSALDVAGVNLFMFGGGEDVSPTLYGDDTKSVSICNTRRDGQETYSYLWVKNNKALQNIPWIGICRGGQLLHVLNGGALWQDIRGHSGGYHGHKLYLDFHTIAQDIAPSETMFNSHSLHHQQMVYPHWLPTGERPDVFATSTHPSKGHVAGRETLTSMFKLTPIKDIEVLYYPNTNVLCVQPHIESNPNAPFTMVVHDFITTKMMRNG